MSATTDMTASAVAKPMRPQNVPDGKYARFVKSKNKKGVTEKAFTVFVNKAKRPVQVVWLNFNKKPKVYTTLAPGDQFAVKTRTTHQWIIEGLDGQIWASYMGPSAVFTVHKRVRTSVQTIVDHEKGVNHNIWGKHFGKKFAKKDGDDSKGGDGSKGGKQGKGSGNGAKGNNDGLSGNGAGGKKGNGNGKKGKGDGSGKGNGNGKKGKGDGSGKGNNKGNGAKPKAIGGTEQAGATGLMRFFSASKTNNNNNNKAADKPKGNNNKNKNGNKNNNKKGNNKNKQGKGVSPGDLKAVKFSDSVLKSTSAYNPKTMQFETEDRSDSQDVPVELSAWYNVVGAEVPGSEPAAAPPRARAWYHPGRLCGKID